MMVDPKHKEQPLPAGLIIKNPIVVVDSSAIGKQPGEGKETQVPQRGYYNRTEAETMVEMVAQLLQCVPETKATSIGMSAPYRMQISLVQEMMRDRKSWPQGFKSDHVLIATVDAFQGSEREFMFVSTVRSSYHGLNFAASLKRINVILSRGRMATFVISNSRVFGRRDLMPIDKKHNQDTKEGLEALQRLFRWQNELENVYILDTWRRIFSSPNHRVMKTNEEDTRVRECKCKTDWEKLYYESWRRSI
jgi:superfamily I DNA and/or RNA helicase